MSNQLQITGDTKVKSLNGVLTGTGGVVGSVPLGAANGVATLDSGGKVPVSQLPSSVVTYLGTWNAATNTPTLTNGVGDAGDMYICNVAGTVNFGAGPVTFAVGDWVLYGSGTWQKSSGQNGTVTSVAASITGNSIGLTGSPITTAGTLAFAFAGTNLQYVNGAGNLTTFPTLISSIGLSMPSAFSVSNSPLTANGTIAVTGAGTTSQYIRGDGSLATYNPGSGGGGASQTFYFNGGVASSVAGYEQMSTTANTGASADFNISSDGYIASFLTDAGSPNQLNIPAGNWNFEIYFNASSAGGTPSFYVELYKYNGSTFTLISSSSANPEGITNGTAVDLYTTALTVPATTLLVTDRLAVRVYVTHSGRTITMHTQDSNLSEVITTFTTGITALNGLTAQVQNFAVGTSGSDFNISSVTDTHTFNLPTASAVNRGALSSTDWTTFNNKQNALGYTPANAATTLTINGTTYDLSANRSWAVGTVTSVGLSSATSGVTIGSTPITTSGTITLTIATASSTQQGLLSSTDWSTFNGKQNTISLTTTGNSGASTFVSNTLNVPTYTLSGLGGQPLATNLTSLSGLSYVSDSFVKMTAAGTFTLDTNTYYLASNPSGYTSNTGTVTSVGLSAPTGFSVTGSPVTTSGTLALAFASGYSLPTNVKQSNWDDAYTWVAAFPTQTGNSGKFLTTDGSTLSWASNPLGTVTSVAMTVPTGLSVSGSPITTSGTLAVTLTAGYSIPTTASQSNWDTAYSTRISTANTPLSISSNTISISQANTTTDGYLSSTDWNTFNNKQGAITLTTTGTSGAATFVGNTLNIPNYGSALSGYLPLTGGTLTGPLNGTSATFTNNILVNDSFGLVNVASTSTGFFPTSSLTLLLKSNGSTALSIASSLEATFSSSVTATSFIKTSGTSSQFLKADGSVDSTTYQGALTLTTTGTSGAATLVGNTLNIPQYSGGGVGITTLNTLTASTQTFATGTSGTDFNISSSTSTHTFNIPSASATARGLVTTGTQTFAGAKTFSSTSDTTFNGNITIDRASGNSNFQMALASVFKFAFGYNAGGNTFRLYNYTTAADAFNVLNSNSYFGILTNTIGSALQVNGNAAIGYSASTAAPTNGLAVAGDIQGSSQFILYNSANGADLKYWNIQNISGGTFRLRAVNDAVTSGLNAIEIARTAVSSVTVAFPNGNILMGTTTDGGGRLQVTGSVTAATGVAKGLNFTPTLVAAANNDVLSGVYINPTFTNGAFTGVSNNGLVVASGNVGIGTSTVGSKLQVNGNAAIGYSASTAAPTNGLAVAGGVTIGTATNNVSSIVASGYSLTGANAQSLLDLAGTWNTTGNPTAIKLNITNTASGATSNLMDLQVGGTSKYKITKEGSSIMTGSFAAPISAKSADYTLTSTDYTIVFDCSTANKTANLPDATTCAGRIYVIKQINGASTYRVTLDGYSTQTIDGSTTWNAQSCNSSVVIQSDGSNWYVIATYNDTSCL